VDNREEKTKVLMKKEKGTREYVVIDDDDE